MPDFRQEVAAEQLGQHVGIHLVGLDLGLGDGLGDQRVGDHHAGHVLLQDAGHGPAVGGRFQGHLIGGPQHVLGEVRRAWRGSARRCGFEAASFGVHEAGRDLPLVHVEAHKTVAAGFGHAILSLARSAGGTRLRVWVAKPDLRDRMAAFTPGPSWQLPLRARGSTGWAAGCSDTTAGSEPIHIIERPLESLGPADLAFFLVLVRRGFDPKPSAQTKHATGRSQMATGCMVDGGRCGGQCVGGRAEAPEASGRRL